MVANGPLLVSVVEEIAILNKIDYCRTVKEQHKFDVRASATHVFLNPTVRQHHSAKPRPERGAEAAQKCIKLPRSADFF